MLLLAQIPALHEWTGMVIIATANVLAVTLADQRRRSALVPTAA
jgi:hypothetical protein